jgi:hypothetical protein
MPMKRFYLLGCSAHTPIFDEPENVRRIMLEGILAGLMALVSLLPGRFEFLLRHRFDHRKKNMRLWNLTSLGNPVFQG